MDQRGSKIPGNFFNLHKKISMGISAFHIFNALLKQICHFLERAQRIFETVQKTLFKTLIKYIILAYFSMKFNKQCVNFWRVWTKITKCWEILRKFWRIFKKLLQKFVKMLYFSIFFTRFNKPMRSFFAVWTKNTNCWEILRKFWEFLMKIQLKILILLGFLENMLLKIEH